MVFRATRPSGAGYHDVRAPLGASLASAVTFLAGVWLVLAPFVLEYGATGDGFDGYWNDVVVGGAIALLALVRTAAPDNVPWFSVVNVALGIWLIAAPFAWGYNEGTDAPVAMGNDIAVGIVVVVMALTSAMSTRQYREGMTDAHSETP